MKNLTSVMGNKRDGQRTRGQPIVVRQIVSANSNVEDGFDCCGFCRVCTCCRWSFFASPTGVIKAMEMLLSLVSQFLLLRFGAKYASDLGIAFSAYVTASSASLLCSAVLLFSYMASTPTQGRVRASLFEVLMNGALGSLFLTSASSLTFSVHKNLFYYFSTIPGFDAYPAMTAAYILGYILGAVYVFDCVVCLRMWRRERQRY